MVFILRPESVGGGDQLPGRAPIGGRRGRGRIWSGWILAGDRGGGAEERSQHEVRNRVGEIRHDGPLSAGTSCADLSHEPMCLLRHRGAEKLTPPESDISTERGVPNPVQAVRSGRWKAFQRSGPAGLSFSGADCGVRLRARGRDVWSLSQGPDSDQIIRSDAGARTEFSILTAESGGVRRRSGPRHDRCSPPAPVRPSPTGSRARLRSRSLHLAESRAWSAGAGPSACGDSFGAKIANGAMARSPSRRARRKSPPAKGHGVGPGLEIGVSEGVLRDLGSFLELPPRDGAGPGLPPRCSSGNRPPGDS